MSSACGPIMLATVPSNIAFVKYWGKRDSVLQWPANDSLSMTLSEARTETTAQRLSEKGPDQISAASTLRSGNRLDKAHRHLDFLRSELGFTAPLQIATHNTFPSDCGIASSASGLAALTVAAISAWTSARSLSELEAAGFNREKLADLARRGSGSACRSLFGGYVAWSAGEAASMQSVNEVQAPTSFKLCDLIVIVSQAAKTHSSTQAHETAWSSPLFAPRLAGLAERMQRVRSAIKQGDFTALGVEIEAEALEMHAVMMSSTPPSCYFQPLTSELSAWIRAERQKGVFEAYFTIDAGPNVHLICQPEDANRIVSLLAERFPHCSVLRDKMGAGPTLAPVERKDK